MAPWIWLLTISALFLLMMCGRHGAHVIATITNTLTAATRLEGVIREKT